MPDNIEDLNPAEQATKQIEQPRVLLTVTLGDLLDLATDADGPAIDRRIARRLVNQVRPTAIHITDPTDAKVIGRLLGVNHEAL